MSSLNWHTDVNDAIRGDKIIVVARKISNPEVVKDSGRHRARCVVAKDNARAWIDVPVKPGPQFPLED